MQPVGQGAQFAALDAVDLLDQRPQPQAGRALCLRHSLVLSVDAAAGSD